MHFKVSIHDTLEGVRTDGHPAQDVGGGGQVQQVLADRAEGNPVRPPGKLAGQFVGAFHLGADLVAGLAFSDHAAAEQGEKAAPHAETHAVIGMLHHQQDGDIVRPARQEHGPGKVKRMGKSPAQEAQNPHGDADIGVDQGGSQEAHQRRAVGVADRFDAGDRVQVIDGRDGNSCGVIDFRFAGDGAEQVLRSWCAPCHPGGGTDRAGNRSHRASEAGD